MTKKFWNYKMVLVLIPLISLLMHLKVFNLELIGFHVWHQTQAQTIINNFIKEDMNILNPKINELTNNDGVFRMEFPIMQWIFALFFKAFGNHLIISRIFSFVIGLFSVYGMFYLLREVFKSPVIATIGAWTFNFSPVFYYYTLNPIPDNFALCCGIWSLGFFFKWNSNPQMKYVFISAFFLGLCALSKLPFILYSSLFLTYLLNDIKNNKYKISISNIRFAAVYFMFLLPAFCWYICVIPAWYGNGVIKGIADLHNSPFEILDMFRYIVISTLPELLINYGSVLFFIFGFYFLFKNKVFLDKNFLLFLMLGISLIIYYFYEINMIAKVHDYYLFPFLPPIFLLVSYGAFKLYSSNKSYSKKVVIFILLILPLTAFLRANSRWNTTSPGFNGDFYKYKNELRALVPNDALCIAGRDVSNVVLLYYIDKKGWTFDDPATLKTNLIQWKNKGAKYIYLDNQCDTISSIKPFLKEKIFDKGSVKVFKLNE